MERLEKEKPSAIWLLCDARCLMTVDRNYALALERINEAIHLLKEEVQSNVKLNK